MLLESHLYKLSRWCLFGGFFLWGGGRLLVPHYKAEAVVYEKPQPDYSNNPKKKIQWKCYSVMGGTISHVVKHKLMRGALRCAEDQTPAGTVCELQLTSQGDGYNHALQCVSLFTALWFH